MSDKDSIEFVCNSARYNMLNDDMFELCADHLGIPSPAPLKSVGVGFSPVHSAWIIPELGLNGTPVGFVKRPTQKSKRSYKQAEGTRGCYFVVNREFLVSDAARVAANHHQRRCSVDWPCPICGKPDWCVLFANDEGETVSVLCGRVSEGAFRVLDGAGYLHLIKPEGNYALQKAILPKDDQDTLYVPEGFGDWAVLTDLGLTAVGRASATQTTKDLVSILARTPHPNIRIVADNDTIGVKGAETLAAALHKSAEFGDRSIKVCLPPERFSDVRDWYNALTPTQDEVVQALGETSYSATLSNTVDSGATSVLVDRILLDYTYGGLIQLRYYNQGWYYYDNTKYVGLSEMSHDDAVRDLIYTLTDPLSFFNDSGPTHNKVMVRDTLSASSVTSIVDRMKSACSTKYQAPFWMNDTGGPNPQYLISFKNGIFNAQKYILEGVIELLDPTPTLFTINSADYDFDPEAISPVIDDKVVEILDGDQECVDLFWEWLGYNMVKDNRFEKFLLLVGKSGFGKGTLLDLMTSVLGRTQIATPTFKSLTSDFGLQQLTDKLSIQLRDASLSRYGDTSMSAMEVIKNITGNDPVSINRKFKDFLPSQQITGKITITVNTLPQFPDRARALTRRLMVLNFVQDFTDRVDPALKVKMAAEVGGCIRHVLAGLKRLYTRGKFTVPASSADMLEQFTNLSSPMESFLMDTCDYKVGYEVDDQLLFIAWIAWCEQERREHIGNRDAFRAHLLSLSSKKYRGIESRVRTERKDTARVFTRLQLNKEWAKKVKE